MGVTPMSIRDLAMLVGKRFECRLPQSLHMVQLAGMRPALLANDRTALGSRLPCSCEIPRAIWDRPAAGMAAGASVASTRMQTARRAAGRMGTLPGWAAGWGLPSRPGRLPGAALWHGPGRPARSDRSQV